MQIRKTTLINFLLLTLIFVIIVISCNKSPKQLGENAMRFNMGQSIDLDQIKKRGKLVALTDNGSTSYFIYKGQPMGYEFELLDLFSKHIGVELEVVVLKNIDDIIDQLLRGNGDIIAANLTVTEERAKIVNFTEHHLITRQVLVQRKTDGREIMKSGKTPEKKLVRSPIELAGKNVYVRKNSSFYSRLKSLSDEIGGNINIIEAPGDYETEYLIKLVAQGEIDYTVADENIALVNQNYYPNIDVKTVISFPQKIAWAVRKTSPDLLVKINSWIKEMRNKSIYYALYDKYFKNYQSQTERAMSEYSSLSGGNISKYDHIIKVYSKQINWDWRLLAALICQESGFNPDAESWAGAFGIMQLMPSTASIYGIDSVSTVAQHVYAGTRYILWLDNYWKSMINDESERLKFVLASYNVGLGHIIDARNLAIKYNRNPNKWDDSVGWFILQKSREKYYNDEVVRYGYCRGEEPYNYVKEVLTRYQHYKNANI